MENGLKVRGEPAAPEAARRGSNQRGMRAYNERLVLSLIRQHGAMAKAEIARRTELSAQTVSVIMRALEADGLLVRGEPVRGKIGQPSVPMSLAADGAFFFGMKVGRRRLDMILTDFLGEVKHRVHISTPTPTPDGTVAFAAQAIRDILAKLPAQHRNRIAGLGIALPFQLWAWAEQERDDLAEIHGWKDRDIAAEISAEWDFPVFVCNDASSACGAELVFGDQNKPDDFLYFFVGFFIGGGLVLDNSLYTGPTGNAAALGSMPVPCRDGEMRQLVDVASLSTLGAALAESDDLNTMIWDAPDAWVIPQGKLDAWLCDAAQAMAHAIVASVCLVDVEHVLVDGWMPETMRTELVSRIRVHLAGMSVAGVQKPDVSAGTIGPDARALGAASLPLSNRFLVEKNSYQKGPVK